MKTYTLTLNEDQARAVHTLVQDFLLEREGSDKYGLPLMTAEIALTRQLYDDRSVASDCVADPTLPTPETISETKKSLGRPALVDPIEVLKCYLTCKRDGNYPTQSEVASDYGISQARVNQIVSEWKKENDIQEAHKVPVSKTTYRGTLLY
jgi:hypothetical protein